MNGQEWTCSHCDRSQISTNENRSEISDYFVINGKVDNGAKVSVIRCLNPDCGKLTADVWIGPWWTGNNMGRPDTAKSALFSRRLIPEGAARPMPDYVPDAIRNDYREACLVRELSPKASATLARRCLQGMIRDFAKISVKSKRLVDEIKALEVSVEDGTAPRGVSIDSIEAISAVRKLGNIGAHMEGDIDVIVDVDPGEAKTLTNLIELLIDDWYVEAHKRAARFAEVIAVADGKAGQLTAAKAAKALPASEVAPEPDNSTAKKA